MSDTRLSEGQREWAAKERQLWVTYGEPGANQPVPVTIEDLVDKVRQRTEAIAPVELGLLRREHEDLRKALSASQDEVARLEQLHAWVERERVRAFLDLQRLEEGRGAEAQEEDAEEAAGQEEETKGGGKKRSKKQRSKKSKRRKKTKRRRKSKRR